jgi:nitrite reductase (NO-forming)
MRRTPLAPLAVMVAVAMLVAACATDTSPNWTYPPEGGQPPASTAPSASAGPDGSAAPTAPPASAVDTSVSAVPELTPVAELQEAPADEVHVTYAPDSAKPIVRDYQATFEVRLEVLENVCTIDAENGVKVDMWGYRVEGDSTVTCGTPGPVLRGRVGDLATITLTNIAGNTHPHNIDFHAVTGQGGGAADLTVAPGETKSITARLLYPGAFMYHCAYGDVPVHIMHGMYGVFIVDPEVPLPPVEHEWTMTQSEWYLTEPDATGLAQVDKDKMTLEEPTYVVFNGSVGALTGDNTLKMAVGERARIFFVNEGLNLASNFHPIGSHWDAVYPEAATRQGNPIIRGSQSTLVVAGGGSVVEIVAQVPQTILLVDHALVRTFYKGALATIVVEGAANADIFSAAAGPAPSAPAATAAPADATQVTITKNGWLDPKASENAFDPNTVTVKVGDTVTWTNGDATMHTVTSGTSDGTAGTPDGTFDSGFLAEGATWSYTFTEAGEFPYYCLPHPWMIGKVIVEP